jgi:hypothetical protein
MFPLMQLSQQLTCTRIKSNSRTTIYCKWYWHNILLSTTPPISSNSVIVTANGVVQYDYTVSGSTLVLNFTPTAGTLIRAAGMGNILTTGTITDDSVSSAKLQANSVSTRELTNDAVQANNILDGTITQAKLGPDIDLGINPLLFTGS